MTHVAIAIGGGQIDAVMVLNGLAIGLLLFVVASGLSVVFGMMDVLNLAHGTLFVLGAYIAVTFSAPDGSAWFLLAVGVALVGGSACGAALAVAVRPLVPRGHLVAGLGTFGIAIVIGELMQSIWGDGVRTVDAPELLQGSTSILGERYPIYRLFLIVAGVAFAVIVYLVFNRGRLGALVRAATYDREMLDALGVRTALVTTGVFGIGAALVTVGGVIGAPLFPAAPGLDLQILVLALVVVTIGGLGSLSGAFVGALLIGQVQSIGATLVPDLASMLLVGTMAVVLVARPQGLFATGGERQR